MNELILNEINLIDKIYKKLTHACYLNLSTDCKRNITHVVEKQWEIIQESSASENIKNIFKSKRFYLRYCGTGTYQVPVAIFPLFLT
jgi:hypothetical protein